ncbi:MAG: tyrosine-type recombinase/integrase [Clostridiales bacterium]|nr:tyrosine-type recombinase/integrase [Clostridiales bacterium]
MLTQCPECMLQVSDKAMVCPHCGYPLMPEQVKRRYHRQSKKKRLPNGFGQISEIKGRGLRKPFRAIVTVGKTETGRPICKLLKPESYFETYNDAYAALVEYHRNPYDVDADITMAEVFERWSKEKFAQYEGRSSRYKILSAWKECMSIHGMRMRDVRIRHLKGCIEASTASAHIRVSMKTVFNEMFDYALEYEITDRNYAREFSIPKDVAIGSTTVASPHITFTRDEVDVLWANLDNPDYPFIDAAIIQCYSGWRPNEVCKLRVDQIDIANWAMRGGSKTDAGKDRLVPIHSRIRNLIVKRLEQADGEYLLGDYSYPRYRKFFQTMVKELGLNPKHKPHDCRVFFVTEAKACGMDEYAIKMIIGHKINDLTEEVYTKRPDSWLATEIEKLK